MLPPMVEPLTLVVVAAGGYGAARSLASFAARTYQSPTDGPGRPPMERVWARTADGWRLSADHHRPAGDPRATVVLCHGLGINRAPLGTWTEEHPAALGELALQLAQLGFEFGRAVGPAGLGQLGGQLGPGERDRGAVARCHSEAKRPRARRLW